MKRYYYRPKTGKIDQICSEMGRKGSLRRLLMKRHGENA